MLIAFFAIILSVVAPHGALANIYGYVDAQGCQHFTNVRPATGSYNVLVLSGAAPARNDGRAVKGGTPWRDGEEPVKLIKYAASHLGVPYRFGGESLQGIDCSAFVRKVFSSFDIQLPRSAREQYGVGERVPRDRLAVGDLVFFRTRKEADYPTHVGIFIGNDRFIHASSLQERRVRIDSLSEDFYDRAYTGATRLKESTEIKGQIRIVPETGLSTQETKRYREQRQ
jgi:cell wall-associated NlpC family hydrolase